ncbi:malate permease [Nostoc sp. 3335mG]|nr:malate permease [Nostoc sp. 3335mG]
MAGKAVDANKAGWTSFRIGPLPLPVFLLVCAAVGMILIEGRVPSDLTTNIALLAIGGYTCAELGKRLPLINRIGAAAIFATFIPSYLAYAHVVPATAIASIKAFTDQSNFLYLFIGCVIVGSILGMDRKTLIAGFLKILIPILLGSLAAALVGCAVGTALGIGLRDTAFRIVLPIMAGGVGEGAIPLSVGYATISGIDQGVWLAKILPSVMFGSLTAILLSGGLNLLGRRRPDLTGHGTLEMHASPEEPAAAGAGPQGAVDLSIIGTALVLAMTLYLLGMVIERLSGFPAAVTMLFLTVALKLSGLVPLAIERGADRNYRFFATLVTYPLLFAIGIAKTPWDKLIEAFNAPTIITVIATVTTLTATGFFVGRLVNLYPIETGIIAACRAGQGGTGDIAILSASNRMRLMPFAQVATRIGGAITVTVALALFLHFGKG